MPGTAPACRRNQPRVGPNQSGTTPHAQPRVGPDQRRTVGPFHSATATAPACGRSGLASADRDQRQGIPAQFWHPASTPPAPVLRSANFRFRTVIRSDGYISPGGSYSVREADCEWPPPGCSQWLPDAAGLRALFVCARQGGAAVAGDLPTAWRRSSACIPSNCVEVAAYGHEVWIRDSASPYGHVLRVPGTIWRPFIRGIVLGQEPLTQDEH
jgi:Domain of unknown function (DUF397)